MTRPQRNPILAAPGRIHWPRHTGARRCFTPRLLRYARPILLTPARFVRHARIGSQIGTVTGSIPGLHEKALQPGGPAAEPPSRAPRQTQRSPATVPHAPVTLRTTPVTTLMRGTFDHTGCPLAEPRERGDPWSRRLLPALSRDLGALLPRLREPDRDSLLLALHGAALATAPGLQRAFLAPAHRRTREPRFDTARPYRFAPVFRPARFFAAIVLPLRSWLRPDHGREKRNSGSTTSRRANSLLGSRQNAAGS